MAGMVKEAEHAAQTLAMQLQFVPVTSPGEIMDAFSTITREPTDALCMFPSPMLFTEWGRIASMAADKKLPTIYVAREGVELGGLMSYGANLPDLSRQTALYVDKILKGAKPAELPVQQPTKFELVINLTAAKALGLTITPNFLLIADEVIGFSRANAPDVLCADLNEEAAAETAAQVNGKGGQALALQRIDVTRRAEVNDMVRARDCDIRQRAVSVQLRRRRHPPRQIHGDRRRADGENLRAQRQRHALRHAGGAAAHARQQERRDRQHGEHGAPARRPRAPRSTTPRRRARW